MATADTVAHAWAHQTGRNCNGHSIFYDGDTIYSYGRHFPIARLVKAGNSTVVFFTTRTYSNTTAKHLSYTRQAVHHMTVFDVVDPSKDDHAANFDGMARAASDLVAKADRARTAGDRYLSQAGDILENANRYAALFGLKRPVLNLESLGVVIAGLDARMKRAKAKAERERKAAEARRFAEQEEARQAWIAGERQHWHGAAADGSALLRVMGDELQTSQGAAVPLAHAIKAFRFVKMVRQSGNAWARNGHVIRVGHFQIDRITAAGDLTAGCHRVGWPEIERIAALIGVADAEASAEAVEHREETAA